MFSLSGTAAIYATAVSVGLLLGRAGLRADATAERLHTLQPQTMELVGRIPDDRPVFVQAFFSKTVPEGFVQTRPPADRKGAIIAAVNFLAFSGMLISCGLAWILDCFFLPTSSFAAAGILALPMGFWIRGAFRKDQTP